MKADPEDDPVLRSAAFRLGFILALALLAHAVLRGIRSPNLWSATHALFNYDFGFSRRGLAGAIIALADVPNLYTYNFFFYCSVAIFVANVLLLILLTRKGFFVGRRAFQWGSFVYFSSAGLVFLSHTIGYFDHIALLVALVAIGITGFGLRYAFIVLFLPLAILVHETGFAIFGPVIGYLFVLDVCRSPTLGRLASCLLLVLFLLVEVIAVGSSSLAGESVEAMYQTLRSKADYPLRRDAFDVLSRDIGANLAIMAAMRRDRDYLVEFMTSLIVAVPAIAFLLALSIGALRQAKNRKWLIPAACFASLSPLALHAVGWDSVRWNTLAITTSYLVLLATVLHAGLAVPTMEKHPSRRTMLAATLIIGFNLSATVTLLDGYSVQSFPYPHHLDYLVRVMSGSETFPSRPANR